MLQRARRRARSLLSGRCVRRGTEPGGGDDAGRIAASRTERFVADESACLGGYARRNGREGTGNAGGTEGRSGCGANRTGRRRSERGAAAALVARNDSG